MLIPTAQNSKTVTDLRERAIELLEHLNKTGPTIIFHRSKPKAVMLSMDEYKSLMDKVEDYIDALSAKDIEENPEKGGKTIAELSKKYDLSI